MATTSCPDLSKALEVPRRIRERWGRSHHVNATNTSSTKGAFKGYAHEGNSGTSESLGKV